MAACPIAIRAGPCYNTEWSFRCFFPREGPSGKIGNQVWKQTKRNVRHLTVVYGFANRRIRISTLYDGCHTLCRTYRADGAADFEISVEQADIDAERARLARKVSPEKNETREYSDAYLETLVVYRRIAEKMPYYDTFLLHGSAVAADGQAYIFTARSGTGKSTHARLWRELLGGRAVMVNDDKPLVRVHADGTAAAFGTPWDGKHHLSGNICAPVRAICVLERAENNAIRPITKAEAFPELLRQAYRPADPVALEKTLALLARLDVKLYRLGCNMDLSAAELSWKAMKGEGQ